MAASTMATGLTICNMDKVLSYGRMAGSTLVVTLKINVTGRVSSLGQMDANTMVDGIRVSSMVSLITKKPMAR